MTIKDQELVDALALSYSDIARLLDVSRQTVRQGINNEYKDYLDRARLLAIREPLERDRDHPRLALIDQRLHGLADGGKAGALPLAVALRAPWTEILCISPTLPFLEQLLTQLGALGPGHGGQLRLYCGETPAGLAPACRALPGGYRIELGHWPVLACLPPLLFRDPGTVAGRTALILAPGQDPRLFEIEADLLPPALRHGPCPGLTRQPWIESRAPVAGRELAQAQSERRRQFDFELGPHGAYRLVMEHAPDWGWLLRLELRQEPRQSEQLRLIDADGREWFRANSRELPHQMLWPPDGSDLERLANRGIFIDREGNQDD